MKLATMTAVIALAAGPCWAVGAQTENFSNTGPGSKAVVDGSPNTKIVSPTSISRGGQGGAGGAGGLGGQGGSATGGTAQGGSASATAGSVTVNQAGGGGGGRGGRPADIVLPSFGGGGMDCPTVGFGASGSSLFGAGGFGPSWISKQCDTRKRVELLLSIGKTDEALQLWRDQDPEVRNAFREVADRRARDELESPPPAFVPSAWCAAASKMERKHNPQSCGPQ